MKTRSATPLPGVAAFKKAILFALCGGLLVLVTQAQTGHSHRKENFDVHKFDSVTVNMAAPSFLLPLTNLQGITVIDARADTGRIGLMQKRIVDPVTGLLSNAANRQIEQRLNKKPRFVVLESGLQQEAGIFLQNAIKFPGNQDLPGILMVVKKLWLSDELDHAQSQNSRRGSMTGPQNKDAWTSGIDLRIEFYLKDGAAYYPLYRYDSTICKPLTVSESATTFMELALQLSLQKMQQMDAIVADIMRRRSFSLAEINQHNRDAFNIPALTDTVRRAGVYLTFDEFKNNNPSEQGFTLQKDKLTDILYLRQPDGREAVTRDVWGYCDGNQAYVKAGDNFFLLQRLENAFYIFGAKNIKRSETANSGVAGYQQGGTSLSVPYYYKRSSTSIQLEPFQLDWYSGRLY